MRFLVMNYLVESEKNSIFAAKWLQDHWRRIRENLSEGRGEDSKMTWNGFCLVTDCYLVRSAYGPLKVCLKSRRKDGK